MDSSINALHIKHNFKEFYKHFWYISKIDSFLFVTIALVNALLESLGLFLIWPVIAIFIDKHGASASIYGRFLAKYTPFDSSNAAILAALVVGGVYVLKNIVLLLSSLRETKVLAKWKSQISNKVYTECLYAPFEFHNWHSHEELTSVILFSIPYVITQFVSQFFQLMANVLLCLTVAAILAYLVSPMFLIVIVFGGALIIASHKLFKYLYKYMGQKSQETSRVAYNIISKTFQAYKEIHIFQVSKLFQREYKKSNDAYINFEKWNRFLEQAPSLLHEVIFIGILIVCMYFMSDNHTGVDQAFQQLGILVVAFFRFIPSLNRISSSITMMGSACEPMQSLLKIVHELEDLRGKDRSIALMDKSTPLNCKPGESLLTIKNACFSYSSEASPVVSNVSLDIKCGSLVVLIGASGGGKSTILNAIMGFLPPTQGSITVSEHNMKDVLNSWWNRVAVVMQDFYILNASIAENVAFGKKLDEIDMDRVTKALVDTGMNDFISTLPDGILTNVGDNGKLLSGGQRQRLALCRALYFNKDVWILDEVTSALDLKTEALIMETINSFKDKVTIIMSAHRPSVFMLADHIVLVKKGLVIAQGKYNELIGASKDFLDMCSNDLSVPEEIVLSEG